MSLLNRFSSSRLPACAHEKPHLHKRGDTFLRVLTIPTEIPDGYFVGWTAMSQARTPNGDLVAEFECAWGDPATTRHLTVKCIDTRGWNLGPVEIDVQFRRDLDGVVRSTSTATITIVKDITA
jgi:hypothetical protein